LKQLALTTAQVRAARKMKAQAQEEALERIRAQFDDPDKPTFVWQLDFAEVFHRDETPRGDSLLPGDKPGKSGAATARNGFDLAIGNPPYIRIQTLTKSDPKLAAYYKQRYQSAGKGNYDLYVCFVERGLELLHQHGQLAFIQPHKFFNAQYGEPLRELLSKGKHLRHIVHFGDQQIFPGATNYVCLLFLAKAGADECRFVKVDDLADWLIRFTGTEGAVKAKEFTREEWRFDFGKGGDIFKRLMASKTTLGDIADKIFQGLVTSADPIYLLDATGEEHDGLVTVESKDTGQRHTLEAAVVRPLCKGSLDVRRYSLEPGKRVLFPYDVETSLRTGKTTLIEPKKFKASYPRCWQYLLQHREALENRENGKMKHDGWYGYVYPKSITLFTRPKILTPSIANAAAYAYDKNGDCYFVGSGGGGGGGYGIILKESVGLSYPFVLGVLNSTVVDFVLKKISTPFRGGYFAYSKQFIEPMPIPPSNESQRNAVETVVAYVGWLHARAAARENHQEATGAPLIAAFFEQWVNALVYELFFPQELHAAGLHFFDLIQAAHLPSLETLAEAERLPCLQAIFKTTYAPDHKLRQALYQLGSLDLVRTIEGKA
jgi:hypothetical protein